ncbi:MAG: transglutaminase-like domain-containing protein, partial [Bacteroidales bacterium]|nr:transglutaminase-like domain-containing protein [Bacteroidales bacterium]
SFKLYNLAEFYPLATQKTNTQGEAFLTTGFGDLLIWAKKSNLYSFEPFRVREMDSLTVVIHEQPEHVYLYDMNPPDPQFVKRKIADEKVEFNKQRIAAENLMREQYMSTFPSESDCSDIENANLTKVKIWKIINKSEGNYVEMTALMNLFQEKNEKLLLNQFFLSLSDKDLRDGRAAILAQHITLYQSDQYPQEVYLKGIISPRIANEGIRPWRNYLAAKLPADLNHYNSATAIAQWMEQHITIDGEANYFNCPISPIGVYELRIADRHSADIFFVAACRSLDIPAYKDNATKQVYAYENHKWVQFFVDPSQNDLKKATLILTYHGKDIQQPQYCYQYTIAKIDHGDVLTFDYENDPTKSQFPVNMEVDAGTYLLTTGNRHIDGCVFSRLEFFTINEGDTIYKEVVIRPLEVHAKNYGTIDTDFKIYKSATSKKIKDYLHQKELIVCFIDLDVEPTKHLLKDIALYKTQFEQWGGTMLFVCADEKNALSFNPKKWNLPAQAVVVWDDHKAWINELKSSINYSFTDDYPLVFISNKKGEVTFLSEGYRIGTGELLYKTLQQ